jgi:death-on-curing protein
LRGIIEDHPFVDGNKRTGYASVETFLRANGYIIRASDDAKIEFVISIARGQFSLDEIGDWVRAHMERI